MVFRKAATPRHGRHPDGGVVPLGQRDHLVPGRIAVHRGADHEGGTFSGVKRVANRIQHVRLGPCFGADHARLHRFTRFLPVIGGNRHQHRPARLLHGDVVGARNGQRHVLGTGRLYAPFDIGLGQLGGLAREQEGVKRQDGACLLPGGNHHGRAVLVGREDVAHGVAHPRGRMQVDKGSVARGLGIAVGHAHHHRFLQTQDVAEVRREIEEQRQLGGAGIAKDGVDLEGAQQIQHGLTHAGTGSGVGACGLGEGVGMGHLRVPGGSWSWGEPSAHLVLLAKGEDASMGNLRCQPVINQ